MKRPSAIPLLVTTLALLLSPALRAETEHEELLRLRKENAALKKKSASKAPKSTADAGTKKGDSATKDLKPITRPKSDLNKPGPGLHLKIVQRNELPEPISPVTSGKTKAEMSQETATKDKTSAPSEFNFNDTLDQALHEGKGQNLGLFPSIANGLRLRQDLFDLKAYDVVDPNATAAKNDALGTLSTGTTDTTTPMANAKTQATDAKPATFNYSHNNITGKDGWKAQGILYLPTTFVDDNGNPTSPFNLADFLHPFADSSWMILYPAIRFNRDSSKDGTSSPVNQLDFLIGADFNFYHLPKKDSSGTEPSVPLGSIENFAYIIRMAAGMHTDFSLHNPKPLFEMSMDPFVIEGMGINTFNYGSSSQKSTTGDASKAVTDSTAGQDLSPIMWKITMRGIGQIAGQPLTVGQVKEGDTTFPLGFQTGLTLTPRNSAKTFMGFPYGKLKVTAMYTGVVDTKHDDQYSGLFEADLELPFLGSDASQSGWVVSYKNGNDLTSHDKVNEVDVAFSIKL
jgi:hypothetical protein